MLRIIQLYLLYSEALELKLLTKARKAISCVCALCTMCMCIRIYIVNTHVYTVSALREGVLGLRREFEAVFPQFED